MVWNVSSARRMSWKHISALKEKFVSHMLTVNIEIDFVSFIKLLNFCRYSRMCSSTSNDYSKKSLSRLREWLYLLLHVWTVSIYMNNSVPKSQEVGQTDKLTKSSSVAMERIPEMARCWASLHWWSSFQRLCSCFSELLPQNNKI